MNKPQFVCNGNTVEVEHPSNWGVQAIHGTAQTRTLDGTEVKDLTWRKYEYSLTWDAMSLADFEALEQLINVHNDETKPITFEYAKFTSANSPVEVFIEPLDRTRRGGQGNTQYYQNVTLKLIEVNSRLA